MKDAPENEPPDSDHASSAAWGRECGGVAMDGGGCLDNVDVSELVGEGDVEVHRTFRLKPRNLKFSGFFNHF